MTGRPKEESDDAAAEASLVHTHDAMPGIRRRQSGRSFVYFDASRRRITDPRILARIARLAIPPAYTDVWICADARGHLQATGRDARGRKQYRYHARWRRVRDRDKFARLIAFGERLPRLRRRLRRDLAREGLQREKVLAVVVSLLSQSALRVGNEEYARANGSYGLTTLRARHVRFVRSGRALLAFRGKSGKMHEIAIDDARLVRLLRRCHHLPGQMLFQYLDDEDMRHAIDSGAVNAYLAEAMDGEFTAKDFRTWTGTLDALDVLSRTPLPESGGERAMASALAAAVRQVADRLHNTAAVCRSSYIHPAVIDAWRRGDLERVAGVATRRRREAALLSLLRRARRGHGGRSS